MSESAVWLRLGASIGALALGAIAVFVVASLAHRTPGPASATNAPTAPAASAGTTTTTQTTLTTRSGGAFPVPPAGAVVFSRPSGSNVLALGVVPGKPLKLQASVLGLQGNGVPGLDVAFGVGSKTVRAAPCGPGCYSATAPAGKTPKAIQVRIRGKSPVTWNVTLPKPWPPRDGTSVIARATREFTGLKSLTTDDSLSSGIGRTLHTHWTLAAPNRLKYQIADSGPAAVIIGNTRWDKAAPGEKWVKSAQTPIHQPVTFWVTWRNAHIVGETPTAYRVTFFDPKTPGWYEAIIAKKSMRTLSMRMQAAAHFMEQRYGNFNKPVHIAPP
jgi:hypothetical protein